MHIGLAIPQNRSDAVRIVGIDPGSTHLGYATLDFSAVTGKIIKTNSRTITGNRHLGIDNLMALTHGDRYARISAIGKEITRLLNEDTPHFVASEAPFYNPRMPMAYGVLVEVVTKIRDSVWEYSPFAPLHLVPPSNVKKAVGATSGANKISVRDAVLKMSELRYVGEIAQTDLDEHAIDAIAVAYHHYLNVLNYFK